MQLFFKVAVLLLKNAQFMLHLGIPKELLHRLLCRPETQRCLECSDFLWNAAKEGGKNKTRQTIFKQRAFWPSVFFGHDIFYVHRLFQLSAITIEIFELLRVLASCLTTWLGILKNHWVAYCLKTLSNQSCKARLTVYCEYFSQTPASWDRLWFSKFFGTPQESRWYSGHCVSAVLRSDWWSADGFFRDWSLLSGSEWARMP